jgi:hypothetical protein
MARIDPELVTFFSTSDLSSIWGAASQPRARYFAINARLKSPDDWYLLTLRDLIRSIHLTATDRLDSERLEAKFGTGFQGLHERFLQNVTRHGQPLAVNEPEMTSVLLDKTGKPEGIVIAEPFADSLAVRGLTELVGPVEPGPPKRRTRRGGSARAAKEESTKPSARVTRIPHMKLVPDSGAITVGTRIDVTVVANTTPQTADEHSESITLEPTAGPIDVEIRLETSSHLEVEGDPVKPLTIDPKRDSTDELTFKVTALRNTADGEDARITAYFTHAKRPCGLVRRVFGIAAHEGTVMRKRPPSQSEVPPVPPITGRLDVRAGIDSDVLVIVRNPSGDLKSFEVEVRTALVPATEYNAGPVDWTFNDVTPKIVLGMFKQFEAQSQSQAQRYGHLLGAGWELWSKAPTNFVDLFWKLVDQGKPLKTIAVVSEEPYIPWELMEPVRYVNSLPEYRDLPLGVEFTVARWTANDMVSAPQTLPLSRSRVVAPRYKEPLEHADEEVKIVLKLVPGERIDPADFAALDANLGAAKASLLHFACHGVANMEDDQGKRLVGVQAIKLEGTNQVLDSRTVKGLKSFRMFFRQRPLVFLNACEVGQPAPSLNGIGGLASSFIDLGAAGVIAPLWSVDDEVAFKVATVLYEALSTTPVPTFAEVMRSVRARAYVGPEQGTDSYAAYCFYGDPLARPT